MRLRDLRTWLTCLILYSSPVFAGDAFTTALNLFGVRTSGCETDLVKVADGYAGNDAVAPVVGRTIHKWVERFGHHDPIAAIEAGAGLSTNGVTGRFLDERIMPDMSPEANRALLILLRNPDLAESLGRQLRKLGLLAHDAKHPNYTQFLITARNEAIDLSNPKLNGQPIDDDVMLKHLPSLNPKQPANRPNIRENDLIHFFKTCLQELDSSSGEYQKSIRSLDMALFEIGQLERNAQLSPNTMNEIFDKMISTANFTVRRRAIPVWAQPLAELSSWIKLAFKVWDGANYVLTTVMSNESGLANVRHEVGKLDVWHKRVPQSVHLRFAERDIRNLRPVVDQFIMKYAISGGPSVFTKDFANDFLQAYPELQDYFSGFYTKQTLPVVDRAGDAFSSFHPEVQKILFKASNFFSILRADSSVFPEIRADQLQDLRSKMVRELDIFGRDGKLNLDQMDLVFTSFVLTALGKAHNPLIDTLAESYAIDEKVGNFSANRRALFLLHHYSLLSVSFSRQTDANQNFLTEIMDNTYDSSLPELLRMESPASNFDLLHKLEAHHLYFVFYQHLLSESKESHHWMTIAPHVLERWLALKALLIADANPNITTNGAYRTYLDWLVSGTDINLNENWDFVVLRLATMMGIPDAHIPELRQYMGGLLDPEKAIFLTFFRERSVFFHGAGDLFKAIMIKNAEQNLPLGTSMVEFLSTLNQIFTAIQSDPIQLTRMTTADSDISIFLKPILDYIQDDMTVEQLAKMTLELRRYPYGYVVHVK